MKLQLMTVMCGPNGNHFPGQTIHAKGDAAKALVEGRFAKPLEMATATKPKRQSRVSREPDADRSTD